MTNSPSTPGGELLSGIALFNSGRFFDAHEVLEDVWRLVPRDSPSKVHFQGLVQVAVAFHHQTTGNLVGARSVLARALRNLRGADATFPQLDLARLRDQCQHWLAYLGSKGCASHPRDEETAKPSNSPPLPTIIVMNENHSAPWLFGKIASPSDC
jgi:hypothetical protein